MNKIIVIAAVFFATTQLSFATSFPATATAKIAQAIAVAQDQQMNFGTITPINAQGTATLTAAGAVTSPTLGVYGTSAAGQFTITAAASTPLTITYTNGSLTNGANTMTVNNFTSTSTPTSNTTDATGTLALKVGADLIVGASQVPGTYNGGYTVTVNY